MLQEITIRTESSEPIKPLLESAIRSELKSIQHAINRTRERIATFEEQFSMTTEEFLRRFNREDLGERLDYMDWWGETKMLALLEEQKRALEGARLE